MKHYHYLFLGFILASIVFLSCERDDICPETTATTPSLIIRFYDIDDPDDDVFKSVRQLEVHGLDENGNVIESAIDINNGSTRQTTDSISLPLRFDAEGVLTSSSFQLIRNSDLDEDDPDGPADPDFVSINYTPQFVYVSRACGYRSIFELQPGNEIRVAPSSENWIIRTEVVNPIIDNETSVHINIYH